MWIYYALILALALALVGQLLSAGGDVFLGLENARPIGGDRCVITIIGWGFASRAARTGSVSDPLGRGINDMRFSMSFGQIMLSLVTLGIVRRVNVDYRMFAGDSPVGDA
ncbi:hypothetical protein [Blastomonas sp.]|uniref:hypothetical protein n=1 Tax=Blastomonas sp. TaxID=1909299 RepID=UPI0035945960